MTAKRILVVDDEPNVVKSCARMLELAGFEVRGVTSGTEAIKLHRREGFDLVLTDLKMPDMDGLGVLTAIREHDPNAAVAIFTAYGTKDNVVEALRLGAREFLEKPLEAKTLIATVQNILAQGDGTVVRGDLRSMSLPSIVQINCSERNQALLRIRRRGQEAHVFFSEGEIVQATLGSKTGEEVIYTLLGWDSGDFELEMGVAPPERTINTTWSGLLLEGMRRLDEQAAGLEEEEEREETVHEGVKDEMTQQLAQALRKIDGVAGVVITARDGIVLAHDLDSNPEKEGAVAVFVGNAASLAGDSMALGSFKWGTVIIGKETMLVMAQSDYYVGLLLSERASPALVAPSAENVLAEASPS